MRHLFIVLCLFVLVSVTGCSSKPDNQANMKEYGSVSKNHHYITDDYEVVTEKIKNLEEGFYLFGYTSSSDTHRLIPVFDKIMKNNKIQSYYIDIQSDAFTTLAQRRMDEFFVSYAQGDTLINRWPVVIEISDSGEVNMISLNEVSEDASTEEIENFMLSNIKGF